MHPTGAEKKETGQRPESMQQKGHEEAKGQGRKVAEGIVGNEGQPGALGST